MADNPTEAVSLLRSELDRVTRLLCEKYRSPGETSEALREWWLNHQDWDRHGRHMRKQARREVKIARREAKDALDRLRRLEAASEAPPLISTRQEAVAVEEVEEVLALLRQA